jgi:transposase
VTPEEIAALPTKYIPINRAQLSFRPCDVEQLIPAGHRARVIWEVVGTLDLTAFEQGKKSKEGLRGRPCWPPQLLVSIWIYGYSIGVASARALERLLVQEHGLRWLAGDEEINYHTLADFRVGHGEALQELFAQLLVLLDCEGVMDLTTILHDGTKVRAAAGTRSYHRRGTLEKRLRQARKVLKELDQRAEHESEAVDKKQAAAQRRAATERVERMQGVMKQLKKIEAETKPSERDKVRVSESEPEARKMKHADGSFALSYNMQVSTEAQSGMIVAVGLTPAANDTGELLPALERVEQNCGQLPERMIVDNGYVTRQVVEQITEQQVELIAPWKDEESREAGACKTNGIDSEFAPSQFELQADGQSLVCPAGKTLVEIGQHSKHGVVKSIFAAQEADCCRCPFQSRCCGEKSRSRKVERVVESEAMQQYLARMNKPSVQKLYKKRAQIAEFPHMWAKAVKKWTRFSVRGLAKAGMEALWVAFAFNFTQWISIRSAA